uniref:Uncharacterized protein n=1 Tax=Arundo donax TaxID=35708 RepID=A0A0A9AA79_ARUDO
MYCVLCFLSANSVMMLAGQTTIKDAPATRERQTMSQTFSDRSLFFLQP